MPSDVETPTNLAPLFSIKGCQVKIDVGVFTAKRKAAAKATRQGPYLENVFSGPYICDIDPLAVDVVAVSVPAAY